MIYYLYPRCGTGGKSKYRSIINFRRQRDSKKTLLSSVGLMERTDVQ